MFAVDSEIKSISKSGNGFIVSNYKDENVGAISYDLEVDYIILDSEKSDSVEIRPGQTYFIKTKEEIKIPDNYVGIVSEKNSVMREGLIVSAPYYQPGHRTYCFLRVHNISDSVITISEGKKIAQILFSELKSTPDVPYSKNENASFNDEHEYKGFGKYNKEYKKEIKKISKLSENLESKVQSIYSNVLVFMGIIAAIFSIITVNFQAFSGQLKLISILSMNLSFVFAVSFLMGLIFTFTNKSFQKKKYMIPYWISVFLLLSINIALIIFNNCCR